MIKQSLLNRISKLEKIQGTDHSFSFFFRRYLDIIDGTSRCLPYDDSVNPKTDEAFEKLFAEYPEHSLVLKDLLEEIEQGQK